MAASVGLPLWQQFGIDVIAPPVLSALWWCFSRGWAQTVQGSDVSDETKARQSKGLLIVLGVLYLIMFSATIYFNFLT